MRFIKFAFAASLVFGSLSAQAALVEIEVVPSDPPGFSMTGSFDFDAATETYSNLNVLLTGSFGPFNFVDEACEQCPASGSSVGFIDPTLSVDWFLSDLVVTWGGGRLTARFRGGRIELSEDNGRFGGTYALRSASTVAEPGTLGILGLGLLGLGLARRRRA